MLHLVHFKLIMHFSCTCVFVPAVSFNALLEICCRTNDLERGQDVIDRMISNGVVPDEFTEQIVSKKRALRSYLKKSLDVA